MPAASPFRSAAATDTGMLREHNEDRYFIDSERGVFLVVDGVGGHAAGELAAQTAVEAIKETFDDDERRVPKSGDAARISACATERVRAAIAAANNRIFHLAAGDAARKGMACVLTLAVVEDGQITVGHVGDSRLYLIWNGAIRKLTSDHSPVGQDEDAGELTEEQAMRHPRRNEVYRDVGTRPRQAEDAEFIEIRTCRFHRDAAILLCSDGLTDHLSSGLVREIVERYDGDAERVANELVEAANGAGGRDNITALFVAGPEFRGRSSITRPRASTTRFRPSRAALTGRAACLMYGLLIGMLMWAVLRGVRG
jgi:PPM family protein phosphatase